MGSFSADLCNIQAAETVHWDVKYSLQPYLSVVYSASWLQNASKMPAGCYINWLATTWLLFVLFGLDTKRLWLSAEMNIGQISEVKAFCGSNHDIFVGKKKCCRYSKPKDFDTGRNQTMAVERFYKDITSIVALNPYLVSCKSRLHVVGCTVLGWTDNMQIRKNAQSFFSATKLIFIQRSYRNIRCNTYYSKSLRLRRMVLWEQRKIIMSVFY